MKPLIHLRYIAVLCTLYLVPCTSVHADSTSQAAGFGSLSWYDYRDAGFRPDVNSEGTFYNPIVIDTAEKLAQLSWLVNEEHINYAGRVFALGADINLDKTVGGEKVRWVPIGYNVDNAFNGMFIGMEKSLEKSVWQPEYSHSITGMYIDATFSTSLIGMRAIGLFGCVQGYLGHLRLTDSYIKVNTEGSQTELTILMIGSVGLLCGQSREQDYRDESAFKEISSGYFHAPHGIYNVAVEGSIEVANQMNYFVGGVVGTVYSSKGVCHSTARVNVTYATPFNFFAGGICGHLEQESSDQKSSIYDCAAHFTLSGDGSKVNDVGGIVGSMKEGTSVVACTASGNISANTPQNDGGRGGICGAMHGKAYIRSCASTNYVDGKYNVGGIVGWILDTSGSNAGDPCVDDCVFAGHIDALSGQNVGGICGVLDNGTSTPANSGLYISGCVMTGTMNTTGATSVGTIAGSLPTPEDNVGGCYYDKSLAKGDVVGGNATHAGISGLNTDDLTSGELSKVMMLDTDDTAARGFTLTKGYYPQVFCHDEWPGYKVLDNDYNNGSSLSRAESLPYWRYAEVDKSNTVYQAGAWFASVPLTMPKGDTAYDLVTYVVGKEKDRTWNEANGREVKVKASAATYATSAACISVEGDTACVVGDGTFTATRTLTANKNIAQVFNRPQPISGTKVLCLKSNVSQEWDGSFSSAFAAGTGTADDPYIIKTGAQLAYAIQNNREGQFYRQLCDITLVRNLIDYTSSYLNGTNYTRSDLYDQNRLWGSSPDDAAQKWNTTAMVWRAHYDGDGHLVKGLYIPNPELGLFGNIASSGVVEKLGVVDSYVENNKCGLLAYKVDGTVTECLLQGVVYTAHFATETSHLGYSGGICAYVGPSNSEALIEDCVTAVYSNCTLKDYTPFVSLPESDNALQNLGRVQNCLAVVPTSFGDANFDYHYTANGHPYIHACHWLLGYEPTATGQTLDELCTALAGRSRWTYNQGYLPTLKAFAHTEIARLMTLPVRTDEGYNDQGYDQYLLGFDRQLLFEPGSAVWNFTNSNIDADGDMGIVVPIGATYDYKNSSFKPHTRYVLGMDQLIAQLGSTTYAIPVRTRSGQVKPGITIEDTNARTACLNAFDANGDGILSLSEVKAVDADALGTAFQDTQRSYATSIQSFPELRFFKGVTSLTTQLNGLSSLTDVKLPYALTTLGSNAFDGCTMLDEVTIPARVSDIEPHPFYGSSIENVKVDPFNQDFCSRDGILFDVNDVLIAYPNGRSGEEIVFEGQVEEIANGAIYKINGLQRIYFETEDYETVPYLNPDAIVSTDGALIDVYVSDATYGSVLMEAYRDDESWADYVDADKLHCYYPLTVGSARAATMYIGFDTELPSQLTPYIVTSTDKDENIAYLRSQPRRVPNRTPVVIFATRAGKYRLTPLDEPLEPWKMYENRLNGVGRDGMEVNQGDADRGSILTLGYNSARTLGFYYYKGSRIAPYRAYLTYNWVGDSEVKYFLKFDDEEETGIETPNTSNFKLHDGVFDLQGRRMADTDHLPKGIYIVNGKKVIITK